MKAGWEKIKLELAQKPKWEKVDVVSYPKSGRTWLRLLLGNYLKRRYGIPVDTILEGSKYVSLHRKIPAIRFTHSGSELTRALSGKEMLGVLDRIQSDFIVLMVRDPLDVLVSSYFQAKKRKKCFNAPIGDFIRDEHMGLVKIILFYQWWMKNWDRLKRKEIIIYENLQKNTDAELSRAIKVIDPLRVAQDCLQGAISDCEFSKLKKMENEKAFSNKILTRTDEKDPESGKFRRGKVGGYLDYLSDQDLDFADKLFNEKQFDYGKMIKKLSRN